MAGWMCPETEPATVPPHRQRNVESGKGLEIGQPPVMTKRGSEIVSKWLQAKIYWSAPKRWKKCCLERLPGLSKSSTSICTVQSICCQGASLALWAFLISSTPASCGGARLTALTGSWTESFHELQVLVLQSRQNYRGSIPINSMEKQNWCACHLPRTARALTWVSEGWILQHKVWLRFEKVCRYWVEILTFPLIWYNLWIPFSMTNVDCFLYRTWACNRERETESDSVWYRGCKVFETFIKQAAFLPLQVS